MSSGLKLPKKVYLIGYGAIGKCFTDILFKHFPMVNLTVFDMIDRPTDKRFEYIKIKFGPNNIKRMSDYFKPGDAVVDLSTNLDAYSVWSQCMENGATYMNTAMEEWDDDPNPNSNPKTEDELYKTSLLFRHDEVETSKYWNSHVGPTTVFEHGMNPGMISHFVKKGIEDAAAFFLTKPEWTDLDHGKIKKYLKEKNYSKLAQAMGLHTIHCSESDNQWTPSPPKDLKEKFYNTWSCRGFLTEGLIPIQIAKGSHENPNGEEFPRIKDKIIMSYTPAKNYWAKSWIPFQNITGVLIPHGEAYTIRDFLFDKETGYAPSQYYVYDFNPYAREFIKHLPEDANINNCFPPMEVMHPVNYEMHGYDKVGAMLIFKNNRGWWSGSIMDDFDASVHFNHKYGPTVLQVAGGVYSCFHWIVKNPNLGSRWPENTDTEFILNHSREYMGRLWSNFIDLNNTHIKDCYKFESFLTDKH